MASIRVIKRRIRSAKNISQITRAMQMVAASKMRRAQERAIKGKPYAEKISQMVRTLSNNILFGSHPLLRSSGGEKILVVLISTNKGLCGGLNTDLFRSLSFLPNDEIIEFVTVGRKGAGFVVRNGKNLRADFSEKELFTEYVEPLCEFITQGFISLDYKKVYLVYNSFISALKQEPAKETLLPLVLPTEDMVLKQTSQQILFEPSQEEILDNLLPYYIETKVRSAILEANASEHSARMIAMKNATDNAKEFIDTLSLEYNKARQQGITNEIADIVTARIAVE